MDLANFSVFQACVTSSSVSAEVGRELSDFDNDADVDLAGFVSFWMALTNSH